MAASNELTLSVLIDVDKANRSIKSVNTSFKNMEQDAVTASAKVTASLGGLETMLLKGMTAANLLGGAVREVINLVKEWTVESAKLAARNDTLAVVNAQLGRVNGYSADSLERLVNRIKALGITTQASRDSVNKMIQAQLDLSKATQLARLAQDAAVISGQNSSEAFEGILHGIATRNIRVLRTYGIKVDLEDEFNKKKIQLGRELTDIEKTQVALDAVLEKGKITAGSYEAAYSTVGKAITTLSRFVEEAKNALGHEFQDELKATIKVLGDTAQWIQANSKELGGFVKVLGAAALGAAVAKFIGWMSGIKVALNGIALAMEANPLVLIATSIAVGGSIIYKTYKDMQAGQERNFNEQMEAQKKARIVAALKSGASLDKLKKQGFSEDDIKHALGADKPDDESQYKLDDANFGVQISIQNAAEIQKLKEIEALKVRKAIATNQEEGLKSTKESYLNALKELAQASSNYAKQRIQDSMRVIEASKNEGVAGREGMEVALGFIQQRGEAERALREERAKEIDKRSNFMFEGKMIHRTLSAEELGNINKEFAAKLEALNLKMTEEESRVVESMWKASADRAHEHVKDFFLEPLKQMLYEFEEGMKLDQQAKLQVIDAQKASVDQQKDIQLTALGELNAVTVQQKVWVEQQRTAIEIDAIKKRTELEVKALNLRTQMDLFEAERSARAQGIVDQDRIDAILDRIRQISEAEKQALQDSGSSSIQEERNKGGAAVRKTVQEHYQSIFQSLKQEAGGVFDALVTKSQSVWKAIGYSLKTALLTAIKDVVTSRIAIMLMNMFVPGARAAMQQGGGFGKQGGGLLGLFGMGSVPLFAGSGAPAGSAQPSGFGAAGAMGISLMSVPGMGVVPVLGPGGTAPFVPGGTPVFSNQSGSVANAAGAGFSLANLKSMATLKNAGGAAAIAGGLMMLGGAQKGSAGRTIGGGALMGAGIGLAGGPIGAIGGVGIGLALDGLRRGGWGGVGETTLGGAMLGFNIAGPLGAAIGAGVGFLAGVARLFVKGASEKAHEKIKSIYGVDISDKKFLAQIVKIANDTYGGNLDVAIRAKDVRDLILLYAQSTGQSTKNMPATMSALSLSQSSGGLFQMPNYVNGQSQSSLGSLPSLDAIGNGNPSGGGSPTVVVPLVLDGNTIGTAVISNGNVVAQGSIAAMKSNNGRRELTALQLSPGLLTR